MAQTSKVAGVVQINGVPAQRTVRAFSYGDLFHKIDATSVNLSKSLGHAPSDPDTGAYTIDLLEGYGQEVFVVAFDDYGADFTPDLAMAPGERVHPTTPNGHVFECAGAGTLPTEEPTWIVDTETSQLYGTASMIARPFYRPMVHGPIKPEVVVIVIVGDPHWDKVVSLLRFEGSSGGSAGYDDAGILWDTNGGTPTLSTETSAVGNSSAYFLDGKTALIAVSPGFAVGLNDYTAEFWVYFDQGSYGRDFFYGPDNVTFLGANHTTGRFEPYGMPGMGAAQPKKGAWQYIAIVRESQWMKIYLDGIQVASGANSTNMTSQTMWLGGVTTGAAGSDWRLIGYIDQYRFTAGLARYTENFTPPTEPFPGPPAES